MNKLEQKSKKSFHNASQSVTNPLNTGLKDYELSQNINNKRLIIDKLMFIALGAIAIWAFYSALMSLIVIY